MDFLFQRYVRVTIHLECLWSCFAKVIKAYLDKVKDHWNSYHIGHSRHDTVSGVPDVLFFLPEYSVATDRLISVEQAQVVGISCPVVWNFFINCGVNGIEVILRILFSLESFQMIANSEHLFLSLVNYRRIYSVHLKKSCFVEEVLF